MKDAFSSLTKRSPDPMDRRDYQQRMTANLCNDLALGRRVSACLDPGLGKTITTLDTLDQMSNWEDIYPVLVIAPLAVARDVWHADAEKFQVCGGAAGVSRVVGTVQQRIAALRAPANIYTINHENIPWLMDTLGDDWPFKVVIADESTRLKSFRAGTRKDASRLATCEADFRNTDEDRKMGVRAARLRSAAFRVRWWLNLTGTPTPNGLKDLWGPTWFLDYGERLGPSYSWFMDYYFQRGRGGFSVELLPGAEEKITSKISDIYYSMKAKDVLGTLDPVHITRTVHLPPAVRKSYRTMERDMFLRLQSQHTITAMSGAAASMKCHQIANGACYVDGDEREWKEVHREKIENLRSLVEEYSGEPLLVAYWFRHDVERILKEFRGAEMLKSGDSIARWSARKISVGLVHPKSIGHGINLQYGGNVLVFFSHSWDWEGTEQLMARMGPVRQFQAGFDRPAFYYYIVAEKTVDEMIIERNQTKEDMGAFLRRKMQQVL